MRTEKETVWEVERWDSEEGGIEEELGVEEEWRLALMGCLE